MNAKEALTAHKRRLRNLTDTQVRNLMQHAANKTPLLPVEEFQHDYVDGLGRC